MEVIMKLEKGFLYHVYNRGNNGERIFYKRSNYRFFIEKIEIHILPYADIMAWCLMPNHFHLMILVNHEALSALTLNQSIGKMLSSYARAVNLQENRTGSLFQQHTKAICLNANIKLKRSWYKAFGVTTIPSWNENLDYPKVCFNYIHYNPVNAGLVYSIEDWTWSSYHEIKGLQTDIELVNLDKLKTVGSL
jgi:putative transposase